MPTVAQGTAPAQTLVIGNTLHARAFTFAVNAAAPTISAAYFAVKTPAGVQLLRVACSIAGAVVTRPSVAAAVTAAWPAGRLNWDIETTIGGVEKTYIKGEFALLVTAQ